MLVGLGLVVLIALLDQATGPYLRCDIFYLVPVVACAWWGGFSHGILLALAGAVARHAVDQIETPHSPAAAIWNSVFHFGCLTLVSSLVSRLHAGILRERRLARTDPLTGAANGRTFYEAVATETKRARRSEQPLTLAYLDLDNFKQLNDRLGHAVGDEALRQVVRMIHLNLRASDLLARLGGDEFALMLPETGDEGARSLLGRLQELLAEEMILRGWPVTMSVGAVTFLHPPDDVDRMIQRVDALMYGAKRKGKGRVEHAVVAEDLSAQPGDWQDVERRASPRVPCHRVARVLWYEEKDPEEEMVTLRDISTVGVGLYAEKQFAPGTVLVVESFCPDVITLLARVVRSVPQDGGWMHGCSLSGRLSPLEMQGWLGVMPPAEVSVPAGESSEA